jgi:5'/3'-nucleotidase
VEPPLILVTNDDGIDSIGLRVAADLLVPLGEVLVVAPAAQQTGMGRSFPKTPDVGVIDARPVPLGDVMGFYHAVSGSPAQAVAHAVLELASRRPALCVSGINNGENLGGTSLISGTIGAALEAAAFGIPALAVSVGPEDTTPFVGLRGAMDWQVAATIVRRLAAATLRHGLPPGVSLLNVNIPVSATLATEIRVTTQSRQCHYTCVRPEPRDLTKPFRLPVAEVVDFPTLEPDSDLFAFLVDKVVSVTPMSHDLTVRDRHGAAVHCLPAEMAGYVDGSP